MNTNITSKKNILIVSVLITCGIILSLFIGTTHLQLGTFESHKFGFGSDSADYWNLSENLKNKHQFITSETEPVFDAAHVPAYPFLLAMTRSIWDNINIAYLLQILLYILICLYAILIAKEIYHKWHQWIFYFFAVTTILSPLLIFYSYGVNCELLAATATLGFIYHLLKTNSFLNKINKKKVTFLVTHIILTILFSIICFLTKPSLIVFVFTILFLFSIFNFERLKLKIITNIFIGLLSLTTLLGWGIKIYQHTGLTTTGGLLGNNLYGNYINYAGNIKLEKYNTQQLEEFSKKEFVKNKNLSRQRLLIDKKIKSVVIQYIFDHPIEAFLRGIYTTTRLFTKAYFPPSDILIPMFFDIAKTHTHFLSTQQVKQHSILAFIIWKSIRIVWRIYNWLLLFAFFLFPSLFINKKSFRKNFILLSIWLGSFFYVVGTGFIAGDHGDRHLITIYALTNLFLIIFASKTFSYIKNKFWLNKLP